MAHSSYNRTVDEYAGPTRRNERMILMKATPVTNELLTAWTTDYENDPKRQMATLALSKTELNNVMFVSAAANKLRQKFSVDIKTLPVTNQMQSGRCWLFAATNVLRERIAAQLNLENFELSQSYLAFWDKFERCNYFFECIIETADLPADDRVVEFVLKTGVHDGGQWDMFTNIVEKYGVVPKDVYDETYQTCHTRGMNGMLNRALKAGAIKLRKMITDGAAETDVKAAKDELLGKIYGFLCSCYGEPPKTFDFEYVDKNREYHVVKDCTPMSFCDAYVGDLLTKTVSLINSPTADKPYHKTFTVKMLGNVVGGKPVKHFNLPMDEFKAAVIAQLQAGKVVWFGSDVGKWGERESGFWDDQCFNAELVTGLDLALTKEDSLNYWFAAMNHAMVITGVNLEDGKPTRWKIENSWGGDKGAKGYYICSDTWFDQYVFQAAVEKEYVCAPNAEYEQEPIVLDPWDPMGTLAD